MLWYFPHIYNILDHVVHLGLNVNSSANNCGCVVDGGNAMTVSIIIMLAI